MEVGLPSIAISSILPKTPLQRVFWIYLIGGIRSQEQRLGHVRRTFRSSHSNWASHYSSSLTVAYQFLFTTPPRSDFLPFYGQTHVRGPKLTKQTLPALRMRGRQRRQMEMSVSPWMTRLWLLEDKPKGLLFFVLKKEEEDDKKRREVKFPCLARLARHSLRWWRWSQVICMPAWTRIQQYHFRLRHEMKHK